MGDLDKTDDLVIADPQRGIVHPALVQFEPVVIALTIRPDSEAVTINTDPAERSDNIPTSFINTGSFPWLNIQIPDMQCDFEWPTERSTFFSRRKQEMTTAKCAQIDRLFLLIIRNESSFSVNAPGQVIWRCFEQTIDYFALNLRKLRTTDLDNKTGLFCKWGNQPR